MDSPEQLPFRLLDDERLDVAARTEPHLLAVTDRRLVVGSEFGTAIDLPIEAIRRIQLDVEVWRPAIIVVVPHESQYPPQVLTVPHEELEAVTRAVHIVGQRLADLG